MTKFCVYNWDDGPNKKKSYGYTEYYQKAEIVRDQLNNHSPTLCMAKWLQVSINLTNGSTQSCYHPPPHPVPLEELAIDISALHNTNYKKNERKQTASEIGSLSLSATCRGKEWNPYSSNLLN